MPQHANLEVLSRRERAIVGSVCEEFERHDTGVSRNAVKHLIGLSQVGKTEERREFGIGTELGTELGAGRRALGVDAVVEEGEDLTSKDHTLNSADGRGFVPGEIELVNVGKVLELEEGLVGDYVGGVESDVVNFGDVDEVVDCMFASEGFLALLLDILTDVGVLEGVLRTAKGIVDDWEDALVESRGVVEQGRVLGSIEVFVGADLGIVARAS